MDVTRSTRALLRRVSDGLARLPAYRPRLLRVISWPPEVERRFFATGASRLPEVRYRVDRDGLREYRRALEALRASVEGDDPVAVWLRASLASQVDAARLVEAVGTPGFHRVSREVFGGARTRPSGEGRRHLDFARHLLDAVGLARIGDGSAGEGALDAEALAERLRARVGDDHPGLDLEVTVDDRCPAKVRTSASRVRICRKATFGRVEAEGLWYHEVEVHALTARNGAAARLVPFLAAGGPRTTATQEGLAVFAELHHRAMPAERLRRLATRVVLVDMAAEGASFLDLYRFLRAEGWPRREAYLDAQRTCRGGVVEGGAPFTKCVNYLGGFLRVQRFLADVFGGGRDVDLSLLACGRVDLDDLDALAALRARRLLPRPRFVPRWLREPDALAAGLAVTSFLLDVHRAPSGGADGRRAAQARESAGAALRG